MRAEHWFLVTYGGMEHHIKVTPARQYGFVIDKARTGHIQAMYQHSKSWLEKNATLRILHDFKWWEYPPKKWRFGGIW